MVARIVKTMVAMLSSMKGQTSVHEILQATEKGMESHFLLQMGVKMILMTVRAMVVMMVAMKIHRMVHQRIQATDKGMESHLLLKMIAMKNLMKMKMQELHPIMSVMKPRLTFSLIDQKEV